MSTPEIHPSRNVAVSLRSLLGNSELSARGDIEDFLRNDTTAQSVGSLLVSQQMALNFHQMDPFVPFFSNRVVGARVGDGVTTPSYSYIADVSLSGGHKAMVEVVVEVLKRAHPDHVLFTFAPGVTAKAITSVTHDEVIKKLAKSNDGRKVDFLLTGILPEDNIEEAEDIYGRKVEDFMLFQVNRAKDLGMAGVIASAEYEKPARHARANGIAYVGFGVNESGISKNIDDETLKRRTRFFKAKNYCDVVVLGQYLAQHPDGLDEALKQII